MILDDTRILVCWALASCVLEGKINMLALDSFALDLDLDLGYEFDHGVSYLRFSVRYLFRKYLQWIVSAMIQRFCWHIV